MKIGIVGFGIFGSKLYQKFQSHANVTHICKRKTTPKMRHISEEDGVIISNEYKSLLPEVDAVVVATPEETHYEIVKDCIESRKDVFVEKPLTLDLTQAKELFALAKKKERELYVDDVFLYRDGLGNLKRLINDEKITRINFSWKKWGTFVGDITDRLIYHDLYLLQSLLGDGEIDNLRVKISCPIEKERIDILSFSFNYNGVFVSGEYDRTFKGEKNKTIEVFGSSNKYKWENNCVFVNKRVVAIEENDALDQMVLTFINSQVNYQRNKQYALRCVEILEEIKQFTNNK